MGDGDRGKHGPSLAELAAAGLTAQPFELAAGSEPAAVPMPPVARVLLSAATIRGAVVRLAAELNRDYAGRDPLLVFIMKGALVFVADLIRALEFHPALDFMVVSSYGGATESGGSVRIVADLKSEIRGRDVLLVEDILDTGLTLSEVIGHLRVRQPASVEVCTLLSKPSRRRVEVDAKYVGFVIPDEFVVGYGLDYGDRYRGLPYIGVIAAEGSPAATP